MKKIMLCSGLVTLLSHSIYATTADPLANAMLDSYANAAANAIAKKANLAQNDTSNVIVASASTAPSAPTTTTTQKVILPAGTTTTVPATTTTSVPANTTTVITTPTTTTTTTTATAPPTGSTSMAPPMNCSYHIPTQTTHIEQPIIMQWADNAARQSFDFDHVNIAQQLANLRPCYTDQGWQSFNEALNKSGNLSAIRTQRLMVTSTIDGNITITDLKENQWRVSVPLQVIYQNEKQKLTQLLTVDLVVGRKISGDLGIMQMIASPRKAITTTNPETIIIKQPAEVVP